MKILLGTKSGSKHAILRKFLDMSSIKDADVSLRDVLSEITDQPLSEEVTISGAKNRAANAIKDHGGPYDFSIGLEGGLSDIEGRYHLVCVAAVIDSDGECFVGVSRKIPLPKRVSQAIRGGKEFGIEIRSFSDEHGFDFSKKEREYVDELISRERGFLEALEICFLTKNKKFS